MVNTCEYAKKALETIYTDKCDIFELQSVQKQNRSIATQEIKVCENQPCRLSYKSINANSSDGFAEYQSQTIKLFISPTIKIKSGSKVVVTRNNQNLEFISCGVPAYYGTHIEVLLELSDKRA